MVEEAKAHESRIGAVTRHVLIAGVGYPFLRDLSIGPVLVEGLRQLEWPAGIEVDDWSFNPIAIVQRMEERSEPYDRIVFLSGVERGREPGRVYRYRWQGELPDAEEIQERIGEAVMGVISLDNLLVVCQHFKVLPPDVIVVEIEPEDTGWGAGFSLRIEAALSEVIRSIQLAAEEGVDA
ncbi:MAG TPA: hydrogenase maturation protease [Thermomicrobiales bacterium]|nr:hydrogenase maturation protease [Thermomicrobiales bacterium]